MQQEKMLPQNVEAEAGVIGSIIIDPEAIVMVADFLKPIHFYRDAHRTIYTVICELYNQRRAADSITVGDELDCQGKLEEVGGASYITSLINDVPTSGNIEYYAHIVLRTWKLRALIQASGEIAARAYDQDPEALNYGEKALLEISKGADTTQLVSGGEAMSTYMSDFLERNGKKSLSGISTGFNYLNAIIGGFEKSKLYVAAGLSGQGKTALCFNFIDTAIKSGLNVLFFSLEMDRNELMERWLAMRAGVDSNHLRDNCCDEDEQARVIEASTEVVATERQLMIDDTPGNTTTAMRAKAIRLNAEHGLDLIVLDYIGIAKVSNEERRFFSEKRLEVEEVVVSMKNLARELHVPVIALSQLNRETIKQADKIPTLHNLAEAAAVENNANVVMLIHKDPNADHDATEYDVNLIIDKNRSGRKASIPLHYIGRYTKFYPIND